MSDNSFVEALQPTTKITTFQLEGTAGYIPGKINVQKIKDYYAEKKGKKIRKQVSVQPPKELANERLYINNDGLLCIPAIAIKASMVNACRGFQDLTMAGTKGIFRVVGDLIPFEFSEQILREDIVRENKVPAVRYRWEFLDWRCEVDIKYDERQISTEQIVNLIVYASEFVGIGEMRPALGFDKGTWSTEIANEN